MGLFSSIGNWISDKALPWIGENLLGIGSSALSFLGQNQTNRVNQSIASQNVNAIKEANAQNIAFQQRENEITRQREDNAVTRASIDMQNAGLSKTLAAGKPASAQSLTAPKTEAPNYSYKYESALLKLQLADSLANYKLKMSEANKNNAQAITLGSQSDYYKTSSALNVANTEIANIVGSKKAKEIDTAIEYQLQKIAESKSNISYNNERILQMSYDITKTIAETEHLGFQTQMLLQQIVGQKLTNLTSSWNLSRNMMYGTPTNYTAGVLGKFTRDVGGLINTPMFGNDFYDLNLNEIMSSGGY